MTIENIKTTISLNKSLENIENISSNIKANNDKINQIITNINQITDTIKIVICIW